MTAYVLDANLLVLLVIGSFDRKLIGQHKRCREFDAVDFDLLYGLLERAGRIVCTPHMLAEASNIVRLIGEPLKTSLTAHFGAIVRTIDENWVPSVDAVGHEDFSRLGLTDASALSLPETHELLTTDYDLYLAALSSGRKATNFIHFREEVSPR